MSTLNKIQAVCILIMLIGMVWLTVDVFDIIERDSLRAAAIVTWVGIVGNAVCVLIRLRKKEK
ncbi:MAG: hypothetical protein Q4G00_15695 [Clostridia bacterium]|nr:hypothetical protein [Clostridia bacterium]